VMTNWSMYRVVTGVLVVIILAASALSAVGLVGFSPGGILVTAVVAIAGTVIGSTIGRVIVRNPLHLESSVITGLLIATIVPPTLDAVDIIGATSAGLLAGISKYLIAPGGRHILNPAATGVSIAVVFGLTFSFWWVATPPLTPLIIIGGLIVAYRAGVLKTVGVFVAVAFVALGARLLTSGEPFGLTVWLMVTSYPVLFLGLFMLTEPLTLPTKQWQSYVVATIVGLGVALPFSLPFGDGYTLYSSPELALVAGNLVAWALVQTSRQRRATMFTVKEVTSLSDDVNEFSLSLQKPLKLEPGQWVELHLPHTRPDSRGSRRVFSVSSNVSEANGPTPTLRLATRQSTPGSTFKDTLFTSLQSGAGRITQVGGEFTPPTGGRPIVCVAGGIGITPFASWIRSLNPTPDNPLDLWLVVVVKRPGELLYPELGYLPGVTLIAADHLGQLTNIVGSVGTPLSDCTVAVSGSPAFVSSAKKTLRDLGASRVLTDRFIGY
jgi:glycine betaine catabolism B